MGWKEWSYWLKGGLIGLGAVVALVIVLFSLQFFVRYLVFDTGEYGVWNTCANQARAFGEDYVQTKCGQAPPFQYKGLYDFFNSLEHSVLKGELGSYLIYPLYFIPGVGTIFYWLSETPVAMILEGFLIGVLIGFIVGKIKSK